MMKNRYFVKGVIDLGPNFKIKDSTTGRGIRHVYIVKDNLAGKTLSISEKATIFLIAKDMGVATNDAKIINLWKIIKKSADRTKQKIIMELLSFIDRNPKDRTLGENLILQIAKGRTISKKQLDIVKFKDATNN